MNPPLITRTGERFGVIETGYKSRSRFNSGSFNLNGGKFDRCMGGCGSAWEWERHPLLGVPLNRGVKGNEVGLSLGRGGCGREVGRGSR